MPEHGWPMYEQNTLQAGRHCVVLPVCLHIYVQHVDRPLVRLSAHGSQRPSHSTKWRALFISVGLQFVCLSIFSAPQLDIRHFVCPLYRSAWDRPSNEFFVELKAAVVKNPLTKIVISKQRLTLCISRTFYVFPAISGRNDHRFNLTWIRQ